METGIFEQNLDLDDLIERITKVSLNLQTDIIKVMTGINQLNLLLTKIKQIRENNNNNLMGNMNNMNNMLNNMNQMNNMMMTMNMNLNETQMMNPMMGLNPMMNTTMMEINPMMNSFEDININNQINIIFQKNDGSDEITTIHCDKNDKIKDIIKKYRSKSLDINKKIVFIFNAKKLNENLTVSESGLINGSIIYVTYMK